MTAPSSARFLRIPTWIVAAVVALIVIGVVWVVISIRRDRPVTYEAITEHFKYGSIGSEPGYSLLTPIGGALPPYWILRAMPTVCRDKLPGGFASLGFISEPNQPLPIGISRRRREGIDHTGLNCAVCHTGTVRDTPAAEPRIILGMPAQQLDLQSFVEFVIDCTLDSRLTPASIRATFPARDGPSLFERALLRAGSLNRLKLQTLDLRNRLGPILKGRVPDWGRGRVDTFNPYKAIQFNWPLEQLPAGERLGASDYPSLWNQKPRQGMHLHWDGDNDSVDERNLSASLGAGVTPVTVDHAGLRRIRNWIWTLPPPPYPFVIDGAAADRGARVYAAQCASCHADHRFRDGVTSGTRVGLVEDIEQIATDRHRLDSYTSVFAANQYGLFPASPYRFTRFRKTNGYANHPLDGIWARAPYLHNGSVPTLRDLLEPPERRPQTFYRGYDVFDQQNVGFVTDVPEADGRRFFQYDTTVPGNGNGGHVYGTTLPDDEKAAIVEYLKRF
jgi:hypothetical protein